MSREKSLSGVSTEGTAPSSQPAPGLPALSLPYLVPRARLVLWGRQSQTRFAFVLPGVKLNKIKPALAQDPCPEACRGRGSVLCPIPHTSPPLSGAQRCLHTVFFQGPSGTSHGTIGFQSLTEYSRTHLRIKQQIFILPL